MQIFIELTLVDISSRDDKFAFGFELYDLKGQKVSTRRVPAPKHSNDGGYCYTTNATFDGEIAPTSNPLTVLISTFKPGVEAKFRFTVHYRHAEGIVKLSKFD